MRLRLFAAALFPAACLAAADPVLLNLAAPNAQVIAGMNLEQVRTSPFGQHLMGESWLAPAVGLQQLTETTGFDPRRDLREILVSMDGPRGSNQVIVLARGTFDATRILDAALAAGGASIESYKGVSIATRAGDWCMAFPDATLAIMGNPEAVHGAIDRISAPAPVGAALAVQVNQLSAIEDIWFIAAGELLRPAPPAPGVPEAAANPLAALNNMLGNAQQVSGGVKFGESVVLKLQAAFPAGQDAAALATALKSLAGAGDVFIKDAYVVAKNLVVTADGPVAKLSLSLPEPLVEQLLAARITSPETANRPQPEVRPAQPPQPAAHQPIHVAADVQKRKLLEHPDPVYPPLALQARISGVVRVKAVIGKDGAVEDATVLSGHPLLVPAALEAVRQWTYEPTLLNGEPVVVVAPVEVNFTLSR